MYKENKKGFILRLRDSRTFKGATALVLLSFVFEMVQPTMSLALTEGPSQPEVQSFEPIGTNQMVDLFTGDFNYNIPLFNLPGPNGGYPVNLAYHAGATMDDEASWVGLGWNINVGSLVRNVRGLPDEFKSERDEETDNARGDRDYLEVKSDIKQSWTLGVNGSISGEIFGASNPSGSLSASVYYNNYNGVGVNFGAGVSVGGNLTTGLSLDSENGLGVSASLSLSNEVKRATYNHSFGFSFDGNLSVDYSISKRGEQIASSASGGAIYAQGSSYGNSLTFARNVFSPSLSSRVNNYSLSFSLSTGMPAYGIFGKGSLGLFYTTQDINDEDKAGRKHLVAGYNNMGESGVDNYYTKDFTRYNDGQITKSNMFLPVSSYDYDVYNSTGQGLSGYFRPRRSDIGAVHDPHTLNHSFGLSGALEVGAAIGAKAGVDVGGSYGFDKQTRWEDNNELTMGFTPAAGSGANENLYYQPHGEMTILDPDELDYINGVNLPQIKFAPNGPNDGDNPGQRYIRWNSNPGYSASRTPSSRVVRNTLVHDLKNWEVLNYGEFKISYFNSNNFDGEGNLSPLNRSARSGVSIANHPAGYKVLNQEGSYYVYGLPAYNNSEIENLFSVEEPHHTHNNKTVQYGLNGGEVNYKLENEDAGPSHEFIHKTKKSPYAHSYLLTSVQGADYVDIANDGPTDDDLGYWVKFNYYRHSDNYQWRSPYSGGTAFYNRGMTYTAEDDKASYSYGQKEIWYMAQIETKSHIAIFRLSARADMRSANGEHGNDPSNLAGMKIDRIDIYEKQSFRADPETAVPLQQVHFEYEYALCGGTPNSVGSGSKKLTLTKLWMTYNGSNRGSLSKYTFDYGQTEFNPDFAEGAYDSWGNYKPMDPKVEHRSNFPYVNQFNQEWTDGWQPNYSGANNDPNEEKRITKETQDQLVSAWCLKKIGLPSGGEINIQYESDDYGYVQHKQAAQMFKIHKMGEFFEPDELYNDNTGNNDFSDENTGDDEQRRRIYFKLEEPITSGTADQQADQVYNAYVEPLIRDENGNRNLYFKSKMRLTRQVSDYVSGYLPLEENSNKMQGGQRVNHCGVQSGTNGRIGFVTVQASRRKNGEFFHEYHPMALAAWTYMQTNAQKLLNNPNSFDDETEVSNSVGQDAVNLLNKLADIVNIIPATASSFGLIRKYCRAKNMARHINLDYSCIRLASPDKVKYGGGHRVKQISITDNWSADTGEQNRTYGQEYDYSIEENGKTISSGVAQYEPQAGGDENALKYPHFYFDKQSAFTKNNLFTEAPVNENLFPGASVGYRKVSVKSINTGTQIRNKINNDPTRGRTGGVTVHEFFTSKEFPTVVRHSLLAEENNTKDVFNLIIPIPLVGLIRHHHYHGTQAFMIELNDMHGKPKSVKSFELNNYVVNPNPITETIYEYKCHPAMYHDEQVFRLDSKVPVILNNGSHQIAPEYRYMGVEYDLFTDQRESRSFHNQLNFEFNIDIPLTVAGVTFPSFWGTFSNHKTLFRTYVTNKVLHYSGILKKTITRDLQSSNESEVLAYDEKSGQPLLTKMKNEFGDDFYSYNIPAYYQYDRMGHAYENINYTFQAELSEQPDGHSDQLVQFSPTTDQINHLFRGDELLVYPTLGTNSLSPANGLKKGYFIGWKNTDGVIKALLHFPDGIPLDGETDNAFLKVVRSGRRNHYASMAANYVTKGDPTLGNVLSDHTLTSDIVTKKFPADMVLSASATIYNDNWSSSYSLESNPNITGSNEGSGPGEYNLGGAINRVLNPFLSGNSGIWRTEKSYSYVGPRKATADLASNTNGNPHLFEDGVFTDEVPMFSWDLGYMEDYAPKWEWVNEVTRYSFDSYETENVNRLGILSSALYGYDNSLSIAVGGNAGYFELGFDDFETAPLSLTTWDNKSRMEQNNLNFHKQQGEDRTVTSHQVNFKNAQYINEDGGIIKITVNEAYLHNFFQNCLYGENGNTNNYLNSTFGITMKSIKNASDPGNKGYYFNGVVKDIRVTGNAVTIDIKPFFHCVNEDELVENFGTSFYGKLTVYEKRAMKEQNLSNVGVTSAKAHTGKRAMTIDGEATFDQPKLKMKANKKYIWSMWVSRDNTDVKTFASTNLVVPGTMSGGVFSALSNYSVSYGKIVEGWQKIDIELSVDSEMYPIPALEFNSGSSKIYVDDIRFSPKTGGMTTYVYDPLKFWLRANLNVDNYATLFFYDEQGNLSLKKQETEKGIFTITESRGHVSED